jgi:tetratricopeptide (TPR) repeat protein
MKKGVIFWTALVLWSFSIVVCAAASIENADTYLKDGLERYHKQNYPAVVEKLTKTIDLLTVEMQQATDENVKEVCRRKLLSAYNGRGDAYEALGQLNKTKADFKQLTVLDPQGSTAYKIEAEFYLKLLEWQQAIDGFTISLNLPDGKKAITYNERAVAYNMLKQYDKGLYDLLEAEKLAPQHEVIYLNLENTYVYLGQYDEALEYLSKIKSDKLRAQPQFHLGFARTYKGNGDYQNAIKEYDAALKTLEPIPLKSAYIERAECYRKTGQNELAEKDEKMAQNMADNLIDWIF